MRKKRNVNKGVINAANIHIGDTGTRDAIVDHVMDWMAAECPSWTIDVLLTHPYQAIDMAIWVLKRMHRKDSHEAIHDVLRRAINARKRGDLNRK